MRTRRVRVGVTPVINKDRHGNDRNSPYVLGEDPRMNNGGNPVIEFDINVPVRNRDGQRVSRGYLRDLAEHLDSPNNLLYGLLREGIQAEVQYDVDEYGVELGVMRNSTETTGPNLGATTLVDFIEFDPDDEADGSSTATKVNLDEDATDELALYLIELAREAGGGFNRGRLRQEPRSEDTNVRVSEALALLSYSAVDRSFGDVNVMNNIESKDIQVPTDIAGVTTSVTWDRMSDGDRANVIAAMRDHLQEESSHWTYTDQGHMAAEVSLPGDTVEDYVDRQIQIWSTHDVQPTSRYQCTEHTKPSATTGLYIEWSGYGQTTPA